jgi:NAD(P)-dependent dehydrogenase (short-subunit alcohol dehydrogenase family)
MTTTLITGATGGIGRKTARRLAVAGHTARMATIGPDGRIFQNDDAELSW